MRSVYLQTLDAYVYPNPVAERIYLKNEALGQVLNLKLFDMQGKPVLVQETGLREGISLEWVDAGVYVCVVNKKGGLSHSFRIVKK